MPLAIQGVTTCALSGRLLSEEGNVIGFPPFDLDSHDPAAVVVDAHVFRDEFEKWELRGHVIDMLREFWSIQYHEAEAQGRHTIIFEDDDYLFVKSKDTMVTVFHRHAFQITIPKAHWREFCKKLQSRSGTVSVPSYHPKSTYSFRIEAGKRVEVCWYRARGGQDGVELSWPEWLHFQSILAVSEKVFDPGYSVKPTRLAIVADVAALVYIWVCVLHHRVSKESVQPIQSLGARLKEICKNAAQGAQREREGQVDNARFQELYTELDESIQEWYVLIDAAQTISPGYPRHVERVVERVKELMRNISER